MPALLGGVVLPLLAARSSDEAAAAGDPVGWAADLAGDTGAGTLRRPALAHTLRAGAASLVYALARDRGPGELAALLEWLRGVMAAAAGGGGGAPGDAGVLSASLLVFAAAAHAPALGSDGGAAAAPLADMVRRVVLPAAASALSPPVLRAFACVAAGACMDLLSAVDRPGFEAVVTALGARLSDPAEAVRAHACPIGIMHNRMRAGARGGGASAYGRPGRPARHGSDGGPR